MDNHLGEGRFHGLLQQLFITWKTLVIQPMLSGPDAMNKNKFHSSSYSFCGLSNFSKPIKVYALIPMSVMLANFSFLFIRSTVAFGEAPYSNSFRPFVNCL